MFVKKIIGYIITWTTYGSWLQGDKRGYVKNGTVLEGNKKLHSANQRQQKTLSVKLDSHQKRTVENAILKEAERVGQNVFAIAVCTNHVHLVAQAGCEPIGQFVRRYKVAATSVLRKEFPDRIWTKGYDKRFCFSQEDLTKKIQYVNHHKNS